MQLKYGRHLRGYLPMNSGRLKSSTLGEAKQFNQGESFLIQDESKLTKQKPWSEGPFGGKQPWPRQLKDFKTRVLNYYNAMLHLSKNLIEAFSLALGLEKQQLLQHFIEPNIFIRLLQVKSGHKWLDVPCRQDALVLNTGQLMALWSNGLIKSTPHRVLNNSNRARYSIPFFYNCSLDTQVKPLSKFITRENPVKYEPVVYGEHLEKNVLTNYIFDAR